MRFIARKKAESRSLSEDHHKILRVNRVPLDESNLESSDFVTDARDYSPAVTVRQLSVEGKKEML